MAQINSRGGTITHIRANGEVVDTLRGKITADDLPEAARRILTEMVRKSMVKKE